MAKLSGIWLYGKDLKAFSKDLMMLANNELSAARLTAMSDFELMVKRKNHLGYFEVTIKLENPIQRNTACLTIKLTTQSVFDFANEIERIIHAF